MQDYQQKLIPISINPGEWKSQSINLDSGGFPLNAIIVGPIFFVKDGKNYKIYCTNYQPSQNLRQATITIYNDGTAGTPPVDVEIGATIIFLP